MEKEINCTTTRMLLDYVKEFKPDDYDRLLTDLHPEIDSLSDPEKFLRDPHAWISCSLASELYQRARAILNNEKALYDLTRHAIEKTRLGYVQGLFVKAFWSTKTALKYIQAINDRWNRNKTLELLEIKKNRAVIRLHWEPHMAVTKDSCFISQAAYTYFPCLWGGRPLTLEEKCCFFEGAAYCEYHLKWSVRNRLHEIISRYFSSKSVLLETIVEMERGKEIIEEKYGEVKHLNLKLNHKINQLLAIQETGKAILSILDLEELLAVIINILSNSCRINQAVIMLIDEDQNCLKYLYSTGLTKEITDDIRNCTIELERQDHLLARVAKTGLPEYVHDVKNSDLDKKDILLSTGKPASLYVVPLTTRSKVIGVIATDASDDDAINMLDIFAPQVAIAIENARLYQKLGEQMRELERSHTLLSQSEKLSFLGNIAAGLAHEIKNPMTSIGTFLQMLPEKYDDAEFRNDFYQIAVEETERINTLITELLDLAREKESYFQRGNLYELIEKTVLLISPQTRSKNIQIKKNFHPDLSEAWMDTEKIKQVILNLLHNAVEFTPAGGEILIKTKKSDGPGNKGGVIIEIRDNGIGIPPGVIDRIFDPYFTTKNKSSMHKGTGLGLFIARQNMLDHGGSLEAKSKVNTGTVFSVTIPNHRPDIS